MEKLTDRRKQLRRLPLRRLGKARLLQRPVRGSGCILKVFGSLTKPCVQISWGQPLLPLLYLIGHVRFIDYEYAGYNYQAFDIGNHFNEFAGEKGISIWPVSKIPSI